MTYHLVHQILYYTLITASIIAFVEIELYAWLLPYDDEDELPERQIDASTKK